MADSTSSSPKYSYFVLACGRATRQQSLQDMACLGLFPQVGRSQLCEVESCCVTALAKSRSSFSVNFQVVRLHARSKEHICRSRQSSSPSTQACEALAPSPQAWSKQSSAATAASNSSWRHRRLVVNNSCSAQVRERASKQQKPSDIASSNKQNACS